MRWVYHSTLEKKEYDSFIYKGVEYQINKYRSPLEDYCRIFEYSFFIGLRATFSFRFNKLFLKDLFDGKFSIKNAISNKKFKWYNGILSGQNGENYMLLQIEKGKILKVKLLDEEKYYHFYNKWIENIMSSNDYIPLLNKFENYLKKFQDNDNDMVFYCLPLDYNESMENKNNVEKYFINWYYDICKKYLPE
jgi:hypothetical protein